MHSTCGWSCRPPTKKGQTIFWSGKVEDDGKGPVEPGAHFYKSLQIDEHGNPINKRNAWASRAVVYVHLIPPGAADTVHFRMHVPESTGDHITLHSKLNYRKFMWWNTQFAFAGRAGCREPGRWRPRHARTTTIVNVAFNWDTSMSRANAKQFPISPSSRSRKTRRRCAFCRALLLRQRRSELVKDDWTRWNDYGIGLFLQGDLKGAEQAFAKITEMDPQNFDGWTNVGRARVQEGNTEGAKVGSVEGLALKPGLARANYFYARVLKEEGKYDEAARLSRRYWRSTRAIAWSTTNWAACFFCKNAMPMR